MAEDKKEQKTQDNTNKIGSLVVSIKTTLNTKEALSLFHGRKGKKNKIVGIIGIKSFATRVRQITNATRNDDPYADLMLLRIEKALEDCNGTLKKYKEDIDKKIISKVGDSYKDKINTTNNEPVILETSYSSVFANIALQVLTNADEVFLLIYALGHIGGITRQDKFKNFFEVKTLIRKTLLSVTGYHYLGINRNDIVLLTARGVQAVEKMKSLGELPDDVLNAKYRSKYAPNIIKKGGSLESATKEEEDDE